MSKPTYPELNNTAANWDAIVSAWRDILRGPIPLAFFADESTLETSYPASQHEDCIAVVNDVTAGRVVYLSDGTEWVALGKKTATINLSTAVTIADLRNDLNSLINGLKATGVVG